MNKTNPLSSLYTKEIALLELQDFMFDTMLPADDCVDWFCDRHEVNATDDVIDFVVDAHFAFHGEWQIASKLIHFFLNFTKWQSQTDIVVLSQVTEQGCYDTSIRSVHIRSDSVQHLHSPAER